MRIALTIAGSDSGGGAGIQADLKTFHQFGVHGTSVIVALTAQNTVGVNGVYAIPPAFVEAQLAALAQDLPPHALKTGMLADAALTRTVADRIAGYGWSPFVVDPVMVSTSGHRLLSSDAEATVRERLLPLATLVTPNIDEAELLTGLSVRDEAAMQRAGHALLELGATAALVKGAHLNRDELVDLLITREGTRRFAHRRIETRSTHGTGCTLSAAITAGLALGHALDRSVEDALDFVQRAIATAPGLGKGHGPLNHSVGVKGSM